MSTPASSAAWKAASVLPGASSAAPLWPTRSGRLRGGAVIAAHDARRSAQRASRDLGVLPPCPASILCVACLALRGKSMRGRSGAERELAGAGMETQLDERIDERRGDRRLAVDSLQGELA